MLRGFLSQQNIEIGLGTLHTVLWGLAALWAFAAFVAGNVVLFQGVATLVGKV